MGHTEYNTVDMILKHEDDGTFVMSAKWTYLGRPVGVWISHGPETNHEDAFRMLTEGMWKAMQDPENFYVDQPERGEMTIEPYWTDLR